MKIINQSVEYLPQEDLFKQIEIAARTCYKSEDKITDDSAKKMVDGLIKAGHNAMLEHGTVYLYVALYNGISNPLNKYAINPYSKIRTWFDASNNKIHTYVTTNYRVLIENNWLEDLKYQCEPTEHHIKRYTLRLTTSISIVRELLRHRVFSFANESTRYCNYNTDKFGKELTFIKPYWYNPNTCEPYIVLFERTLREAEETYKAMEFVLPPQQAREVLPLCTKSELVMTGFESDWKHFFDLRLFGVTGKPHPDMEEVAGIAFSVFKDAGIAKSITGQSGEV